MKKLVKLLLSLALLFSLTPMQPVYADNTPTLEEILSKKATDEEVYNVGVEIANRMSTQNENSRVSGEIWTLDPENSHLAYGRRAIKGKFQNSVSSNTTYTYTISIPLESSFEYKPTSSTTLTVTGGVTTSEQITRNGPGSSDYLSNGQLATHRLFIGITFGEIYYYTFIVTDKYTGAYLRTETTYAVVGAETFALSQLMRLNTDGSITVGNLDNNAVKTFSSLSTYKSALQRYSYTCKDVIYF